MVMRDKGRELISNADEIPAGAKVLRDEVVLKESLMICVLLILALKDVRDSGNIRVDRLVAEEKSPSTHVKLVAETSILVRVWGAVVREKVVSFGQCTRESCGIFVPERLALKEVKEGGIDNVVKFVAEERSAVKEVIAV